MRRAVLVTAAVVVVGLGLRQRWRRQLADALRLPVVVLVAFLLAPLDWIDDAWGFVSGVAGDIKDFVLGVVRDAFNIAMSAVDWIHRRIDDLGGILDDFFTMAIDFAKSVYRDAVGFAQWLVDAAVSSLDWFIGQVQDIALGAWHLAGDLFDRAINIITTAIDDLWHLALDYIFTPLWNLIQMVWHEVLEPALDWLLDFLGGLIDRAMGFIDQLFDIAGRLWDWATHWATRLLQVVEKCWDWLVKLAEHGPGWVIDQVNEAFHDAPAWLADHLSAAVDAQGDQVEQFFADWLG